MKAKTIVLLAGLAFFCGCRQAHPLLVPEISPPLVQEEVFSWTGRLAGNVIFPCAGGLGWVDESGRILTWDPEKKATGLEIKLPFPVIAAPFRQGNFLALKNEQADHLQVWDLHDLKIKFELHDLKVKRILAVDGDCLVYLDAADLIIYSWKHPAGIFRLPAKDGIFFNCEFLPDRILILGQEKLFTFFKNNGQFESKTLPQPAASPFFSDGENIYYGSARRFLVKLSLADNRPAWKLKLGQVLGKRPFAFSGSIVAGTADHNFLQVNVRGSILWWQALGSTMSFDLLPMSEHLAAFLLNGEVKFIDPRRRQVTVFKGVGHPLGQPLAFGHDVYFMLREGPAVKLQRLGNRYAIDIELEPAKVRWLGQSVRFALQTRNLLEAAWDCVIRDAAGQQVFSKSMETTERVSLAWLPQQPGKFTIRVQARALNRSCESEISVQILDPLQALPGFYLHF
jgi:hypothetical protein